MTKREQGVIDSYIRSDKYNLHECYKSFSDRKWCAYKHVVNELLQDNGEGLKILSYNTFMFTAGYLVKIGEDKYLVRITPTKKELIKISPR